MPRAEGLVVGGGGVKVVSEEEDEDERQREIKGEWDSESAIQKPAEKTQLRCPNSNSSPRQA
jgi:hypothetical protein